VLIILLKLQVSGAMKYRLTNSVTNLRKTAVKFSEVSEEETK